MLDKEKGSCEMLDYKNLSKSKNDIDSYTKES